MLKYFEKIFKGTQKEFYNIIDKNFNANKKMFIVTANPETIMIAGKDNSFSKLLLDDNTIIIPDGIGVVKAANMLGYKCEERITGIELVTYLFKEGNNQKKSIYLFGAKQEVINSMKKIIIEKYPNLNLIGVQNGYVEDRDIIFKDIESKKPDIILVALGIPHQEKIIYKYINKFNKGIFVGVGGSFDTLSGYSKRAPKIFIKLNLEWLYRLLKEPKRIKRFYNSNIKFMFKVIDYKKRKYR